MHFSLQFFLEFFFYLNAGEKRTNVNQKISFNAYHFEYALLFAPHCGILWRTVFRRCVASRFSVFYIIFARNISQYTKNACGDGIYVAVTLCILIANGEINDF